MKTKSALLVIAMMLTASSAYAADATMKADNQSIDTACATDAQTAGCSGEVVGKGLLKCLHAYKKANKGFTFSAGCQAAMKQRHADKAAGK